MKARMKRRRAPITKVKSAIEIRNTIKATRIVEQVFRNMESPFGRSEADVAKEIRQMIRNQGASLSFKPIIASGRNSSFVHHKPGRKIVKEGELVIFDIGANYRGSCSDVTRMHVPKGRKEQIIYRHIIAIQKAVIKRAKPGVTLIELHDIFYKMMKRKGFKVKHLIGHGLGSKVHERVKEKLEPGMVITVEPGIYLKNFGGCRVEDMILVTKGRPRVLSASIPALV